ncbi:MAG: hypothetical protein HYZ61_01575 [Candidatus Andersenbacteria bacterium]|nr:hypothetical protein [Candidatus Andersenbacteria bacterium]
MAGKLISFDGLDSSGKATQVRLLVERLRAVGQDVLQVETPDYSTPSGKELKARLQGKLGDWMTTPWQDKVRYFATNRVEHKDEVITMLKKGGIVVYDRYVPSSLVFMEIEAKPSERAEVHATIEQTEYEANGMPHEHLSLFLDVPPQIALKLLGGRKKKRQDDDEYTDQFEVQQKMHEAYIRLASEQPNRVHRIQCVEEGRLLSPKKIAAKIWTLWEHL